MHQLSVAGLSFTLVIGWSATIVGFLAPWWPAVDLLNHFRPVAVAGSGLLLAFSLALGSRKLATGSAGMLAVTLALMLAALLFQAPKINAAGPILRVVTINTWTDRRRADRIIHFIEQSDADIVLLQEIGETDRAETLPQLQTAYPYIFVDERARNGPAILSRRPWSVSGIVDGSTDRPVAVWARFELNGRTFTVASVHPAYPFLPDKQAEDVDRLIAFVRAQVGPIVLGGDFNLTPFSWQLAKLVRLTGLKWAQTFSVSWPANRLLPIVLLDHVLTREPLGVVQTHTAKAIGSDHLPIVTDLSFWR